MDYIFSRLLDGKPDDEEVIVDAQLLIYAGEYYEVVDGRERRDEVLPPSKRAPEMLQAAESGRFSSAERRWPEAPIRQKIENAARRASGSGSATTKANL